VLAFLPVQAGRRASAFSDVGPGDFANSRARKRKSFLVLFFKKEHSFYFFFGGT
jgi:hypothetical protein